jgi:hypothetical protein
MTTTSREIIAVYCENINIRLGSLPYLNIKEGGTHSFHRNTFLCLHPLTLYCAPWAIGPSRELVDRFWRQDVLEQRLVPLHISADSGIGTTRCTLFVS